MTTRACFNPFAPHLLLGLVDGDQELSCRLLQRFLEQIDASWGALEAAVIGKCPPEIARRSHFLKGSVALLGAADLAGALEAWERAARQGESLIENQALWAMKHHVYRLAQGIREFLDEEPFKQSTAEAA
jgi:HPt (histidine-containing phosphotransfer) domain-containing protein